jgi:Tol biopolymer transport system component
LHELVPGLFGNVMTIGADGRRLRALTTFVGGEVHGVVGSYSPDGRWIVYREQHPDRAPLMIMRPTAGTPGPF